jgi:antitoxin CptB
MKTVAGQLAATLAAAGVEPDSQSNICRNRLIFRSWHRGTQESDFLLGSFADSSLAGLDDNQLRRFESLLDCSDPDLFEWILGGSVPPAEHNHTPLERSPTPGANPGE